MHCLSILCVRGFIEIAVEAVLLLIVVAAWFGLAVAYCCCYIDFLGYVKYSSSLSIQCNVAYYLGGGYWLVVLNAAIS